MRVLITGATGFVGSHAAAAARAAGHEVRLLIRDPAKAERVLRPVGVHDAELVRGDVTHPASVTAALDGCDAVVHTAAVVALDRAGARAAHVTNTTATSLVLGEAVRAGCDPIVHVSSVSVFERRPPAITLDSPLRVGASGYSASKVESEWIARGLQAAGLPVATVYPSGVIGPDAPSLTVLHTAAQTWIRAMPMISSGINLIDVRDLGAMIAAALEPGRGPRRLMAGGRYTPWPDLVDEIERRRGRPIRRYPAPGSVMRGFGRLLDVTRLPLDVGFELTHETMSEASQAVPCDSASTEAELGVSPRPVSDTLVDTYRWIAEQGGLRADEIGDMHPGSGAT